MSIATKTGDKGDTGLFGGKRVKKYDLQVEAYGGVDEATCFIGLAYESISNLAIRALITDIQYQLYIIMAYLSEGPMNKKSITSHLKIVEKEIIHLEDTLPKLTRFILPQGSEEAARLQIARAMIRSAERRVVSFIDSKKKQTSDDVLILKYLNRLSDLFFLFARLYSEDEKVT